MIKQYTEGKTDFCSVFSELKALGVKTPKIKKFKSSIPKQTKPTPASSNKIFGVSISEQEKISVEDCTLPKFIVMSTNYLMKYIDREIGLFRKAGSVSRQKDLRLKLERGESIAHSEPNDVASLLKQWLRELPEPLIPVYLHDLFVRCLTLQIEDNRVAAILLCCHLLPFDHFCTLKHLVVFLFGIAKHRDKNKMGAHNLALIMAPNIFVMRNDSIDKSSNVLVQQHTSVIELLINNAHKVGSPCSFPHLAEAEALKCDTDLDLSTFLDYSPSKSKKKRKSGGVQDLFTGLKKLVGQNSLSPNRKRSNQDDCNSDTRSALKRKADDEHLPSMSPLKKQATVSSVLHNESSSGTPINKIPKTMSDRSENSRKGHSRRKSFNLLKKKEKKRQKSVKFNVVDSKLSISIPNSSQENLLSPLQVPVENELFFTPPSISPINVDIQFIKSGFMKKSVSDCYLTPSGEKSQNKIFSTSSEGCLPVEGIPSPYCLRSTTVGKRTIKHKSDEITCRLRSPSKPEETDKENSVPHPSIKLKVVSPIKKMSYSQSFNLKDVNTISNTKSNESETTHVLKSSDQMDSLKVPNIIFPEALSCEKINENLEAKNYSLENTSEKSLSNINISRSNIKDVDGDVPRIPPVQSNKVSTAASVLQNEEKVKRNCSIYRREALIVKPKISKTTLNQLKRADSIKISKSKNSRISNQNTSAVDKKIIQKSNSNSIAEVFSDVKANENNALSNVSDKKHTKRNLKNGSIVRGKPNTIKTGLPTDVYSRYSSDSFSGNSKHKALSSSSSVDNDLFVNVVKKSEKTDPDLSLIHQIENLTLSPKENETTVDAPNCNDKVIISPKDNESKIEVTDCNDEITISASVTKTIKMKDFVENDIISEISVTSRIVKLKEPDSAKSDDPKTASKVKGREKLGSNSDSKVQKTRKKSSKVSRINSFPERVASTNPRKGKNLRAVKSSSPRKSYEKEDKTSDNTNKENHCSEESQKQAYLNVKTPENKTKSPEQWFSGRKFLEAEEATQKDDSENKRESIAMILRNNRGHVRAKASLYEPSTRSSCNNTPMLSITPYGKFYDSQCSNTQSSQKRSTSARSTKSRRNLPLPPPPKFVIPETSPIPSYPLKELTNLSNSEDIFFTPPSAQKSLNSSQNSGNSSRKKRNKCTLKPKMNSYSGHTPYKFPVDRNKVCRSESSPFLLNVAETRKSERLAANSLTKCHSPSSNENYYSSPVFKTKSALSIEKLKSDELLDEWNCEM